jgi:hypothetical protein
MMKKWIQKKDEISEQEKGSRRGVGDHTQAGKEYEMELELMKLFTLARQSGKLSEPGGFDQMQDRYTQSYTQNAYFEKRILYKLNTLGLSSLLPGFKAFENDLVYHFVQRLSKLRKSQKLSVKRFSLGYNSTIVKL